MNRAYMETMEDLTRATDFVDIRNANDGYQLEIKGSEDIHSNYKNRYYDYVLCR